jgi:hypothetical protein
MASVLEVGWLKKVKKEICDVLGKKGQGTNIIGSSRNVGTGHCKFLRLTSPTMPDKSQDYDRSHGREAIHMYSSIHFRTVLRNSKGTVYIYSDE